MGNPQVFGQQRPVNDAVPVQVPKSVAQLQANLQSTGDRQVPRAELVAQWLALWKIGDQKRAALVRTEGENRDAGFVRQAAQGPRLALESSQLAPAFHVARIPELQSSGAPILEPFDSKGGAMLGGAQDLKQTPASPDDLMEKGVGARMHGISPIGGRDLQLEIAVKRRIS